MAPPRVKTIAGLLAKSKIPTDSFKMVYEVPATVDYSRPLITILNTSTDTVKVKFFATMPKVMIDFSKIDDIDDDQITVLYKEGYIVVNKEDFIEYDVPIEPSAVLERWMMTYDSSECMFFMADMDGCVVRITGIENSVIG